MGKRALVLSGGGARGAFEAGAAEYLIEQGKDFDVLAGVSVGALNAAMLAMGRGPEGLRQQARALTALWLGIRGNDDFYRDGLWRKVLALFRRTGVFDPAPTRAQVEACVDPAALEASGREFRIGAVRLESGNYEVATQRTPGIRNWILASASMPVAFPPVTIGRDGAMDGGIRNITPLQDALQGLLDAGGGNAADPDEVWVVLASPLTLPPPQKRIRNVIDVGARALEILIDEVYREDILYAIAINRSVRAYTALERTLAEHGATEPAISDALAAFPFRPPRYRPVTIRGIAPQEAFMGYMDLDPTRIRAALQAGRAAAKTPLDEAALERLLRR